MASSHADRVRTRIADASPAMLARYSQASQDRRMQARAAIGQQLGKERAQRWAQWAEQTGRYLHRAWARLDSENGPTVPIPPEAPSDLTDPIAELRDPVSRDLLIGWAWLARVVLEEAGEKQ